MPSSNLLRAELLRNLFDDPESLSAVACEALATCHFDPNTCEGRRRADLAKEDCEALCYDRLMHCGNQRDRKLLDRQLIRSYLLDLANAQITRPGHYNWILS